MIERVVAYSTYAWGHALTTLRIIRPLEQAGIHLIQGNQGDDIHPELVSQADAVLIQREFPDYAKHYNEIIKLARSEAKPVIYEIDDLLLELPDEHPDQAIDYYTPALFQILRALLEADLVSTTTPELERYFQDFNQNTVVLPNYLDDKAWKPRPPKSSLADAKVTIGYMGSSTHTPDIESIAPALVDLLGRYPDRLCFHTWGVEPPSTLREHPQVTWTPLLIKNYEEFAAYFSEQDCDIFIAPLVDSFFNQCKSAVKYYEYSILGVPGVYTRIAPYERVITHGENGLLASTLGDWQSQIISLIENQKYREEVGAKAQKNVLDNWRLSDHAHKWAEAYRLAGERYQNRELGQKEERMVQTYVRVAAQVREWQSKLVSTSAQKDAQIEQLKTRLSEIENSNSWKTIQFLGKIRRGLLPSKSGNKTKGA